METVKNLYPCRYQTSFARLKVSKVREDLYADTDFVVSGQKCVIVEFEVEKDLYEYIPEETIIALPINLPSDNQGEEEVRALFKEYDTFYSYLHIAVHKSSEEIPYGQMIKFPHHGRDDLQDIEYFNKPCAQSVFLQTLSVLPVSGDMIDLSKIQEICYSYVNDGIYDYCVEDILLRESGCSDISELTVDWLESAVKSIYNGSNS